MKLKIQTRPKKILLLLTTLMLSMTLLLAIPGMLFAQESEEEEAVEEEFVIEIPEKVSFDVVYPEISAKSGETYEFKVDLNFMGADEQTFDLLVEYPEDWIAVVTPAYEDKEITAVKLEPSNKESLKIIALPIKSPEPGEYEIKLTASNEDIGLEDSVELTAIVTARYELSMSPKSGMLNTEATAGKDNMYTIILNNTGSADLENIEFSSDEPSKWIIEFDPENVEILEAGKTEEVKVSITPPQKTIAGDYLLNISVSNEDVEDDMDVRVTVETPSIWGWVGIGIIVIVIVGVAIIFARLGRR